MTAEPTPEQIEAERELADKVWQTGSDHAIRVAIAKARLEGRNKALATIERMDAALARWENGGCPDCHGDCSAANPPVTMCIMRETRDARAALKETAR